MSRARVCPLVALCCIAACGGVSLAAPAPQSSTPAWSIDLRDTAGSRHTSRDWTGARAIVLIFVTPDCPVSQGYVPEMNRLHDEYASRGVTVYAVQSDLAASDEEVRRHVAEYGYRFPVLVDRRHALVEYVDAAITPEAVVLTPAGQVVYQGRIDDRIPALGVRRPRATRHELRDALDALLDGRPAARQGSPAVGCFILRQTDAALP